MWGALIVIARRITDSQWRIASVVTPIVPQKRGQERREREHAVLDVERRGFQALFSGAHQRTSRNGPSHDEARPWWGVSPWLIWRLYVYYDTRGRNTSSSLLANRSEKSAKLSRSRDAPRRVHERRSGEACSFTLRTSNRAPFPPTFLSCFLSFLSSRVCRVCQ